MVMDQAIAGKEVTLSDIADIFLGGTPKTNIDKYWGGDINWASAKDVANCKSRYIEETEKTITEEGINNSAAKILPENTILITSRGTVGATCLLSHPMSFNQTCYGLVAKESIIDPLYLFYKIRTLMTTIDSLSYGTIFNTITKKTFDSLKFILPSLPEQKAIASILGALDDKIELNRKMNETLEAMARAIFKSWFVDFDPSPSLGPHKEWHDSPLGKIPKGWRILTIGDIAENVRKGIDPGHITPDTPYIGLEHMPRKSIALSEWDNAEDVVSNKFLFRKNDILFGKLRPYFHKVGVAALDGCCSTDILVTSPKKATWYGLVLLHISSDDFVSYADGASSGTKMPRTNWTDMARYKIVFPGEEIAEKFNDIIWSMVQTIQANIFQSRTLATIRDALLPKLLSGKLQVNSRELKEGINVDN